MLRMGVDDSIKELKRMKMNKSHLGAEYNALMTAINCMERQQKLKKEIRDMQTYSMLDGDIELYLKRSDVARVINAK